MCSLFVGCRFLSFVMLVCDTCRVVYSVCHVVVIAWCVCFVCMCVLVCVVCRVLCVRMVSFTVCWLPFVVRYRVFHVACCWVLRVVAIDWCGVSGVCCLLCAVWCLVVAIYRGLPCIA